MTLRVSRDQNGNVTITNSTTGKSEVVSTSVLGRGSEKTVSDTVELPGHMWGRLS